MILPNAAENFTISTGVRFSPGNPPMVPLIPDMLLINAKCITVYWLGGKNTELMPHERKDLPVDFSHQFFLICAYLRNR
jgi:hypothetical protein